MMGIPMIGWVAATLGYYARDVLAPGRPAPPPPPAPPTHFAPPQYVQPFPPPGYAQPHPYGPGYGPPPGYPQAPSMGPGFAQPAFAQAPQAPPPRHWHSPFPLDGHMDEATDRAIAQALARADVATLRGFAQSIERHYPAGAVALRTRAWHIEQAQQAPAPAAAALPPMHQAPPPAAHDITAQPAAPRADVQNYAQLLTDMVEGGAAELAAQAPPPPPVRPEPVAAPARKRRVVVSVGKKDDGVDKHANGQNGAAKPAAQTAPEGTPPAQSSTP
jgi:hypothetical protein